MILNHVVIEVDKIFYLHKALNTWMKVHEAEFPEE